LKIESVEFVRSAVGVGDLPDAGAPELSLVGRSNVGKSTLINALLEARIARTSATPGKTRLINLYRVVTRAAGSFYLVDLPGYGYARGPRESHAEFDRLAAMYFARASHATPEPRAALPDARPVRTRARRGGGNRAASGAGRVPMGVLLLVDARHPGLDADVATGRWLRARGLEPLVVVTKIDKLTRSERARSLREFEQSMGQPVVGVSAETGEGMEDLWKRMASWIVLAASSRRSRR
jgi:GTP-binding protein